MKQNDGRIRTMHAGSLPRPKDVRAMLNAKATGEPYDAEALDTRVREAVKEVVQKQIASGIDSVNDGELSKPNFTNYARDRLSGFELRDVKPGDGAPPQSISARDQKRFSDYFAGRTGFTGRG